MGCQQTRADGEMEVIVIVIKIIIIRAASRSMANYPMVVWVRAGKCVGKEPVAQGWGP